jgi:hypothetical protein
MNFILKFIWILDLRFHMQYLLYCVVCFRVWGTTKEMIVVDVVEVALTNDRVFAHRHAHHAEVAPTWYKKANGIPSPFGSDTYSP